LGDIVIENAWVCLARPFPCDVLMVSSDCCHRTWLDEPENRRLRRGFLPLDLAACVSDSELELSSFSLALDVLCLRFERGAGVSDSAEKRGECEA
jgi:hypothetical protein